MRSLTAMLVIFMALGAAYAQLPVGGDESFFEAKIRPVLTEQCFKCHGPKKVSGGLRLDARTSLMRGGEGGAVVVAGQPEKSRLIQALRHIDGAELKMPPDKKLPEHIVADFTAWVKRGAVWPAEQTPGTIDAALKHWAFQPVRKPPVPHDPTGWAANPIDCFILAKLNEQGLRPVAQADGPTLLRRLYFDVVGLPPAVHEVEEFDRALDAGRAGRQAGLGLGAGYTILDQAIDRVLASPHYGERWGRHWMDVVRYADTAGDNADYPVPEARLYRDYIIDAFNGDMPYDQFVREQLAGDILAEKSQFLPKPQGESSSPGGSKQLQRYAEQLVATGFLALSRRYATAPYEFWHLTLEDTIDTVGQAFLGMTLRCARCHDHKFDPVTMRDYYGLYGIFDSTQFPWAGGEEFESMKFPRRHFVPLLPQAVAAPRLKAHADRLAKLQEEIARLDKQSSSATDAERKTMQERLAKLRQEHVVLLRNGLPPDVLGAYAVHEGKAKDATIQKRGDPGQAGAMTPRTALAFLPGGATLTIPSGQSGRLQLADWITRPDSAAGGLTARVMVNRIWQHHFGRGLVATPSNFGTRGAAPTHPELLDYLAAVFVESGWSVKAMHRLILTSKTWQLSSRFDATNAAKDTGNTLYWRHDRRRLDAEAIRDALMSASGTLNRQRPGPHPFPPIAEWHWTQHNQFKTVYDTPHRSVYLMTQRLQRHPFLALFDGPDTNTTTEQRPVSTVPQQALHLMNSPEMQKLAGAFAIRLLGTKSANVDRIRLAHLLCYARPATGAEVSRGEQYLKRYLDEARRAGVAPDQAERQSWTSYARILMSANEFVYVD